MSEWMYYFRRKRDQYTQLPTTEAPANDPSKGQATAQQKVGRDEWIRRTVKVTGIGLMLVMLSYVVVAFFPALSRSWGQYSPYFSVSSDINAGAPKGCKLTFAQVLSRHGARAPTLGRAVYYAALIERIHEVVKIYNPGYDFLKTYNYTLGADQLTLLGQQQMVNSGLKFYHRYHPLARKSIPFIRAGGQQRVVDSAMNFTQGFHSALLVDKKSTAPRKFPYDMVTIPEYPTSNNTLHHSLCPAFEDGIYSNVGQSAQATYLTRFAPPITARLNLNLPGANLTDAHTVALMDLCPFNTVALPTGALSPFCHLFTHSEWQSYDYFQSLGKWYGFGPGNPLGPTQGVGFVNELLARLTQSPVEDYTSSNSTLDGDERTFPLDRTLYADFSHDNDMMTVLGALGVYDELAPEGLDKNVRHGPGESDGFAASWAVPFSSRVYVEKMRCEGHGEEEMVRVLVNDRVVRLGRCGGDERGLCKLGKFVESMKFARDGGRWGECFV
ncbi:hypothetical protein N0V88_005057 [Collariella sp. IMI 366227]|nr:hypothetical protein N0V88_005057 [Collariella sp. IMI 366227]